MNTCSLNTEQELNVHIEKCDKNLQSPLPEKSSKSYDCKYCETSFTTEEELVKHGDKCDIQFRVSMSAELKRVSKLVAEIKDRTMPKPKPGGECYFCRQTLYNAKEAFKHRGGCRVFQISQAIEQMYRRYKLQFVHEWPPNLSLMYPSSPKPSLSKESEEKDTQGQQNSSRKRILDTDTEKDRATSTLTPETSSSPPKICRSDGEDTTDIETERITTADRNICDDKKNERAKGTLECVFCLQKFPSADVLKPHIVECCKTYNM
ncbi:uncharacterized protein LOC109856854 [Pseudomyrmex gracilis]|uniref:uncharacterized protein LOC109856854 n=1 Tax=Pseudomyrmex gracilis TaxID=219809 RepID=UPI000995D5B3|nr:uncharacterized protein LOC109856854 [Pseudomyrmex gracilis]